ncbi:MAG: hypothetical protein ABSG86_07705 [Thermoguttaceae bacterium]|jgi:hypothetical protein
MTLDQVCDGGPYPPANDVLSGVPTGLPGVNGTRTDCPAASAASGVAYADPGDPTIGTAVLTEQNVADALMLAPTSGQPAEGSAMGLLAAMPSGLTAAQALTLARLGARFCGTAGKVVLDIGTQKLTVYQADNTTILFQQPFNVSPTTQTFQAAV